jgi:hypothetical protein
VAGRYYSSPESLSRAGYSETTRTKISIVPADIFESFLLTLASVVTEHYACKRGLRPLSHTPEINNAEFYDNVIAGNFPDRFSGGNNVPCHADLLAKAINPSGWPLASFAV